MAAGELGEAFHTMMAHPLALQLRNLQSLVEIGVDKNTTVVFPAPLMSTIAELGSFLASEQAAATRVLLPRSDKNGCRSAEPEPPMQRHKAAYEDVTTTAADGLAWGSPNPATGHLTHRWRPQCAVTLRIPRLRSCSAGWS